MVDKIKKLKGDRMQSIIKIVDHSIESVEVSTLIQNELSLKDAYEDKVEEQKSKIQKLEVKNKNLKEKLKFKKRNSLIIAIFSLIAVIFMGSAIEIINSKDSHWSGWVLLIASILIELGVFVIMGYEKKKK
jgi:anaerobic C4-dicarboxylate transporter